jgi:hypothetical protein
MKRKWFLMAPAAIIGMVAFIAIGGEIVRLLWNWLLPGLFGWRLITFWQAVGLLALCRILFGGISGRGFRPGRRRMNGRWQAMTPEEREKFREHVRSRCGGAEPPATSPTA